jgi:ABC-type long-subunit fatty acid transport system fused permease/ATPase subunit
MEANYYLTAVPSIYTTFFGKQKYVYQLTANHETNYSALQNVLYFSYELSPIAVSYYMDRDNVTDFFIKLCSIVGGLFTVAGIVDSFIYNSFSYLFKSRIRKDI